MGVERKQFSVAPQQGEQKVEIPCISSKVMLSISLNLSAGISSDRDRP